MHTKRAMVGMHFVKVKVHISPFTYRDLVVKVVVAFASLLLLLVLVVAVVVAPALLAALVALVPRTSHIYSNNR